MDPKWIDHYHSKQLVITCFDCKKEFNERMVFFDVEVDGEIENVCENCFNREGTNWKLLEV